MEESFFRGALPTLFGHYSHFKLLNAMLFSLVHLFNMLKDYKMRDVICMQLPITFLLGLHLGSLDNLSSAIIAHITYNSVSILALVIISRIFHYLCPPEPKNDILDFYEVALSCDHIEKESKIRPDFFRKFDEVHGKGV